MSRDKQIEEMAKITCICNACGVCECDGEPCDLDCSEGKAMEKLYNAGYRKASDVVREIFEEIYERLLQSFPPASFIDAPCTTHDRIFDMIAELKKKYTESEKDK